jgi:hypothetical protein
VDDETVIARAQDAGYRLVEGEFEGQSCWRFDHDTDPLPWYSEQRHAVSYMDLRLRQIGNTYDGRR